MKRSVLFIFLNTGIFLSAGCGDLAGFGGVSGEINGQSFSDAVATADDTGGGSYVITISDSSAFSCSASSAETYLTVVITDINEAPSEIPASDSVAFNQFADGVSSGSDFATSGTVSIDEIGTFTIDGSIDAFSANSNVSGSFSADICN